MLLGKQSGKALQKARPYAGIDRIAEVCEHRIESVVLEEVLKHCLKGRNIVLKETSCGALKFYNTLGEALAFSWPLSISKVPLVLKEMSNNFNAESSQVDRFRVVVNDCISVFIMFKT